MEITPVQLEQELQRLAATNFFVDKPPLQSISSYLLEVSKRQAIRFGHNDPLAQHYAALSAARRMEEGW